MTKTRKGKVTFKGNPLDLVGAEVKVGDQAPLFVVTTPDMKSISLSDFKGKALLISAVPSLDTAVCNIESRRFSKEAEKFKNRAEFITISLDLPFAQDRWAKEASCNSMKLFSDYKERSFGLNFGVLIDQLKLLARAIFILDNDHKVRYIHLVKEMTEEPPYDKILQVLTELLESGSGR